jgi:hypothetical protein
VDEPQEPAVTAQRGGPVVDNASRASAVSVNLHRMTRAFSSAAADLLLEHGPLSLAELHALAVEQGLSRSKTPSTLTASLSGDQYVVRPDGRYDTAARLLRGQVFTTRRRSMSDGVLWTYRDLDPLTGLPALPLALGGELRRSSSAVESWTGPAGWLPEVPPGALLALRWDGTALHLDATPSVPDGDSERVRDVREVLGRHARGQRRPAWSYEHRPSLRHTVLSALVEDPQLFTTPLPPLRELLPLPEDLRPQDAGPRDPERTAIIVEVPVPLRTHEELARRADLLGERLPDYLSLLLTAAADRVQLPAPRYDRYEPYEASYPDDVVRLDRWSR